MGTDTGLNSTNRQSNSVLDKQRFDLNLGLTTHPYHYKGVPHSYEADQRGIQIRNQKKEKE